jgi:flavin reductase (DIM6/NTAB) family NADH-FMN oxidoreductase RutF
MHRVAPLKVLYFGTPVVLISSRNEDGSANLAPMSSAWWLGQTCLLGLAESSQTAANLHRERECVLNLPSSALVDAVDRIALLTARPDVPPHKVERGYTHSRAKFAASGLTEQRSDLVAPPRAAECPVQLECRLDTAHRVSDGLAAFQVSVVRTHVAEELLIPGKDYVDPVAWDPLIMKFCEFFGNGENLRPSQLAAGWQMPHGIPAPAA